MKPQRKQVRMGKRGENSGGSLSFLDGLATISVSGACAFIAVILFASHMV